MAISQQLAYRIEVSDGELRAAIANVQAFNSELARSTVTGARMDTTLRSIGRRASQVGSFFLRNLSIPIALVGVAAGKLAADFDSSFAKIGGLTNTSAADLGRLKKAAFDLSGRLITEGPAKLGEAMFFLQSAGFTASQTIAAMPSIIKAAAAGLGSTAVVADAAANAMDAFGIAGSRNATKLSLSAKQAVAILIGTVKQGKVNVDSLAGSIGRVIPIANAMGVSFDQVGASIASLTRQGLNANLATTGLRALFQTFLKAQPQTQKALATIGTSTLAVQKSLADKQIGVFSTLIALREEFDKQQTKPLGLSTKDLTAALGGEAEALAKVKNQVGAGNEALAKLFPNIRALTAFLIITGPRRQQNASIFAHLKQEAVDSANVIERAYRAKATTSVGRFQLSTSQLKGKLTPVGHEFLDVAAKFATFITGVIGFLDKIPHSLLKLGVIGLAAIGPIILGFGRATQAASFGVTMWGRWQAAATEAAFAANGVNIAQDKALIAARKSTVVLDQEAAAATRTAAAMRSIASAATTAGAATGRASGGIAALGGVKGRETLTKAQRAASGAPTPKETLATSQRASALILPSTKVDAQQAQIRVSDLQARAQQRLVLADDRVTAAQVRLSAAQRSAIPNQVAQAHAELASAEAAQAQASAAARAVIVNERTIPIVQQLQVAEERLALAQNERTAAQQRASTFLVTAERAGVVAADQEIVAIRGVIASLEQQLVLEQRVAAGQQIRQAQSLRTGFVPIPGAIGRQPLTGFGRLDTRAKEIQAAKNVGNANVRAANISATAWGTAAQGMKSAGALAFDFIALSFAANLLGKVVFDSHKTSRAVTHDLLDIHKAGVAAVSGIALLGIVGIPKIVGAFGRLRGGVGAFEALGIATLGWRAKLAIAGAGILGLQQAGINMEHTLSAVFLGLTVRALVMSTAIRGAVSGIAVSAGFAEIAASVGAVTLAFGAWPIALGVAAAVILAQTPPIKHALDEINDGFASVGKSIDDINGKGGGHFFQDFFKHGLFAKGGVHPGGIGFGPSGDDLRNAKGVTDETKKQSKSTAAMQADAAAFKRLLQGVPPNIARAATQLRDSGKDYAAHQLLATFEAKKQFQEVKAAIALFKKEGKPGLARLLGGAANAIKDAKKVLDSQFAGIETSITRAFDDHTSRMLDTFDRQTDGMLTKFDRGTENILNAFDRQTSKLEDKLKVKVSVPKLHETFTVTVNGKTPAEKELEALDRVEAKRHFQRDIFDANRQLATALQVGDPQAIRDAERARQDAVAEKRRFDLEARAKKERAAADKAIPIAKDRLDEQRKKERQALEDGRNALRQDLSDRRDILRRNLAAQRDIEAQALKQQIEAQKKAFDKGKIDLQTFYKNVLAIMARHNVSIKQAGRDGGKAYADQMKAQFDKLKTRIDADLTAITKKAEQTNKRLKTLAAEFGKNFLTILNPGVPGSPGVGASGSALTGRTSPTAAATASAARADAAAGRPTRSAIIRALRLTPRGQIYTDSVPKRGIPTEKEYKTFLAGLDSGTRHEVRVLLRNKGFFKAATGGVVPSVSPFSPGDVTMTMNDELLKRAQGFAGGGVVGRDRFHHERNERLFVLPGSWPGLLEDGNIDLLHRPSVPNQGKSSSVLSTSFQVDGREVLVPQVLLDPPRIVSQRAALAHYLATGESLGIFDNPKHANRYANALHLEQAALEGRRAATGMVVPGFGSGDSVPALLTPNEIVLNAGHQEWMKRTLGIGGNAHGLFNFIDRMSGGARRFATGGVVDPGSGGKGLAPILPGFGGLRGAIKDLVKALTHNALTLERSSQNTKLLSELVSGGKVVKNAAAIAKINNELKTGEITAAEAKKLRAEVPARFVKDTEAQKAALRHKFDPQVSVEKLISDPRFAGLSSKKLAELRAKTAQIEAHPVLAGLITTTPTGTKAGGTSRLTFGNGPVTVQARGGGGHGSADIGGGVTIEHVDIHVSGSDDPKKVAAEVRRELLKTASRNTAQRRGRHAGTTIGAR